MKESEDCTMEVYMSEESEESNSVMSGDTAWGGGSSKRELLRVLHLERESCEHLRWTHLEQVPHCTDLSARSHFQRT